MAKPLIIDCDPGVDDAIALLLAFAAPQLQILGITTVAGNVPLSLTQKNAGKICEIARRVDLPIYAGCPRPMLRPLITAEYIHGVTGLDGANLPEPQMPIQPQHAVDFLIDTLMAAIEPITLATLGPLTNVAIALIKEPRIVPKVSQLVCMGGAIGRGNVTASAEFNIYVDPHAAQVVFTSGLPLTLIGLDVTHQVLTTAERLAAIRGLGTPVSQAAAALLTHYGAYEANRYGVTASPLHDPCVIAYLMAPHLFTSSPARVDVETISELTMGRTVVDFQAGDRPFNAQVVQTLEVDDFYHLLIDSLARL
jgi:purine nucleosidase